MLASVAGFALVAFLLIRVFGNVSDEDLRGHTPRTLLDDVLKHCREGRIDEALASWTPESIERFPEIREWSKELGELSLEYGEARHGKYDTIVVIVAEGTKNSEAVWRHFYFEVRDSNWHLHWYEI